MTARVHPPHRHLSAIAIQGFMVLTAKMIHALRNRVTMAARARLAVGHIPAHAPQDIQGPSAALLRVARLLVSMAVHVRWSDLRIAVPVPLGMKESTVTSLCVRQPPLY